MIAHPAFAEMIYISEGVFLRAAALRRRTAAATPMAKTNIGSATANIALFLRTLENRNGDYWEKSSSFKL